MSRFQKIISLVVLVSFLTAGCTQFKPPPLLVKVPSYYSHKTTFNRLTLVADPYLDRSKVEHFFNTDILKDGFLAVHFIAFNEGIESYDLSNADFSLVKETGEVLKPLEPKQISKKVLRHTSLRMLGWGLAGLIVLTIPFSLAAGVDSRRANKRIKRQIAEHVLKYDRLEAHESIDGFYFFRITKRSREIGDALKQHYQFRIKNVVQVDTGEKYDVSIAIN